MYVRGTDGLWGFRIAAGGEFQPTPGSPMSVSDSIAFHPQGQYAVVSTGLQIQVVVVAADGSISAAQQTIDVSSQLRAGPSTRGLNPGAWSRDGSIVCFVGGDEPLGASASAFFYSFSGGRLSPIPGSPLTAGDAPAFALISSDGYAYAFHRGRVRPPDVSIYRVSTSQVSYAGAATLPASEYSPPAFLDGERLILAAGATWARLAGGALQSIGGSSRTTFPGSDSYVVSRHLVDPLDQRLVLFHAFRAGRSAPGYVMYVEGIDTNGRLSATGPDVSLEAPYEYPVARAQGGRVVLTYNSAFGVRAWPVDASGQLGAPRTSGLRIFGDPRSGVDPTGQLAYLMWREVDGVHGLRVAPDGQVSRFDPLPTGVRFRIAEPSRVLFNTR
jgi:hypothetical protein